MPRQLRLEYAGAIYHVMNRGDRREPIFHDDLDRKRFVAALGEVCAKTDWQVHAYCLMNNHFHLVMETPNANLAAQGGAAGLSSDYHTYGTIMLICGCAYVVAWLIFHAGVPRIQPAR